MNLLRPYPATHQCFHPSSLLIIDTSRPPKFQAHPLTETYSLMNMAGVKRGRPPEAEAREQGHPWLNLLASQTDKYSERGHADGRSLQENSAENFDARARKLLRGG